MDTNALKKFAPSARSLLLDQVSAKLELVLDPASLARREHPRTVRALEIAIKERGKGQVIEEVAYTWFNRFAALRFMDANGYTSVRVVSPAEGQTRPEILSEAMAGNLPDGAPGTVAALLDGRTSSHDAQGEAYRLLLAHACNQWHGVMHFLFEKIDDYSELLMPEDLLSQTSLLARLRTVMTEDACQNVEIIGWLYQFYISEKKDQVFAGLKKNQKITPQNIPAATQLFTPHWIVRYLVENSLGRLWLLNRPQSRLAERMDYYIAPEEPETDFLNITRPEEIRICDPAAGSGHMLTYAFDLLYAIYEEEGYDATEIPALILTHNLTGVEIDDRAGALAAFALAMKAAAKLGRRRFLRMAAKPDICVLQNVAFTPAEMQNVAAVVGKDLFTDELRETLGQFERAKNYGSLIVPKLRDVPELRARWEDLFRPYDLAPAAYDRILAVLRMAEALSPKYHVVVANPPYAAMSGLNAALQTFLQAKFPESKSDLFSAFIERGLGLTRKLGYFSMVTMQSWMFLSSHEKLRQKLGAASFIICLAQMENMVMGIAFGTSATVWKSERRALKKGAYCYIDYESLGNDSEPEDFPPANERNRQGNGGAGFHWVAPDRFASIPGQPIAYWPSEELVSVFRNNPSIGDTATARKGMATGRNEEFVRHHFEVSSNQIGFSFSRDKAGGSGLKWFPYANGGEYRKWYGNLLEVVNWEADGNRLQTEKHESGRIWAVNLNLSFIFRRGIKWNSITSGKYSARLLPKGSLFSSASNALFSEGQEMLLLGLLNTKARDAVSKIINPTLNFNPGEIEKIPLPSNSGAGQQTSRLVALAKSDWDAYEISWDFTTLPLLSPDHRGATLEDSYNVLRTQWQGMTDEMQRLEEENNRIFIDAYGLQDELTHEVPIEEITLTCNPAYRYGVKGSAEDRETRLRADTMVEFLSYAVSCMFGRYSLDAPGLILANQGERLEDYLARVPNPTFTPDADNVIPVLEGDWFADDITDRFRLFLRVTFGEVHFRENLRYIEDALGKDIRKYFTRDFYADHVKRYKKRPIYWMFSSPKGAFNALIYMHRYRGDTVSVMLNEYLREFITKLEAERTRLEKLSDDPTATQSQRTRALKDAGVVIKQIDELTEWEREVVFPLAQRKVEIDLDDGVKANYPKLGAALKPIKGLETADG